MTATRQRKERKRIRWVYAFPNGMVAVCDQYGQQMPKYQGRIEERCAAICRDAPPDAEFKGRGRTP